MRGLIDGMRCGVVTLDLDGRLRMANEHATRILGLSHTPEPGEAIESALAPHGDLIRVLRDSFGMAHPPNRAELALDCPRGGQRTIGFTISMVRDGAGVICGAAAFFKDLTQIEQREEQERLRDRLAALGEMAASMAHEIRNPLAAIDVTCSLIRRRLPADDGTRELLDKITVEVRRLSRTVDSSLEFVRPVRPTLTIAHLSPVIDEAIALAAERAARPGVRIDRQSLRAEEAFLMDRTLLREVITNLVLNAIEAVQSDGCVSISTEVTEALREPILPEAQTVARSFDPWQEFDRYAVIRVRDNGPGIGDQALSRLFQPFCTTKKNGSGVGLSTAKKIIDSHRGSIDVNTAPDGGACFTVRLPMVLKHGEV